MMTPSVPACSLSLEDFITAKVVGIECSAVLADRVCLYRCEALGVTLLRLALGLEHRQRNACATLQWYKASKRVRDHRSKLIRRM